LTAVYQAWKAFVSFTDPVAMISRSSARPPPAGGKAPAGTLITRVVVSGVNPSACAKASPELPA
jgi:hypothetical protein